MWVTWTRRAVFAAPLVAPALPLPVALGVGFVVLRAVDLEVVLAAVFAVVFGAVFRVAALPVALAGAR